MALANIREIAGRQLVQRSAMLGRFLLNELESRITNRESRVRIRGVGLLAGVELFNADGSPATETSLRVMKEMLSRGFILLPEGEDANVLSFTPPLMISKRQLASAVKALAETLSHA
jgi:4-aminobutyrate aminotransferase-like enzyme